MSTGLAVALRCTVTPSPADVDATSGLLEFGEHEFEMGRVESGHRHRTSRDRTRDDERAGLDAVADHVVLDGVKRVDTLDGDRRGAAPADARTHTIEEVDEIDDLGFARRVLDHGRPAGYARRSEQVLCGADAREVQDDVCAVQSALGGDGVDEAVTGPNLDSELGEPADVHVDLARPDVASARHRDMRLPIACNERSEHRDGSAHLGHHLVRRLEARDLGGVHGQRMVAAHYASRQGRTSTSDITSTSTMSGTLVIRETPGASRAAAMSLSAEFFAPSTRTWPESAAASADCDGFHGCQDSAPLSGGRCSVTFP